MLSRPVDESLLVSNHLVQAIDEYLKHERSFWKQFTASKPIVRKDGEFAELTEGNFAATARRAVELSRRRVAQEIHPLPET